jgi:hypothetical protein
LTDFLPDTAHIDLQHMLRHQLDRLADQCFKFCGCGGLLGTEQPIEPRGEVDGDDRHLRNEVMQALELERREVQAIQSGQYGQQVVRCFRQNLKVLQHGITCGELGLHIP